MNKINATFNCFLNLFTSIEHNAPIYGIEAVFCDSNFNTITTYTTPLNVYEQKYLGYVLNIKDAKSHHEKYVDDINKCYNAIVSFNNIDSILRFDKSEETGEIATTLFWTDTRKNSLNKYNELIYRVCEDKGENPYEFHINPFLGRCYYTRNELISKN